MPQYANLLEDDGADANRDGKELSGPQSGLVRSHEGWQKEMAKWVEKEQARRSDTDSDEQEVQNITYSCQ